MKEPIIKSQKKMICEKKNKVGGAKKDYNHQAS